MPALDTSASQIALGQLSPLLFVPLMTGLIRPLKTHDEEGKREK